MHECALFACIRMNDTNIFFPPVSVKSPDFTKLRAAHVAHSHNDLAKHADVPGFQWGAPPPPGVGLVPVGGAIVRGSHLGSDLGGRTPPPQPLNIDSGQLDELLRTLTSPSVQPDAAPVATTNGHADVAPATLEPLDTGTTPLRALSRSTATGGEVCVCAIG